MLLSQGTGGGRMSSPAASIDCRSMVEFVEGDLP